MYFGERFQPSARLPGASLRHLVFSLLLMSFYPQPKLILGLLGYSGLDDD